MSEPRVKITMFNNSNYYTLDISHNYETMKFYTIFTAFL